MAESTTRSTGRPKRDSKSLQQPEVGVGIGSESLRLKLHHEVQVALLLVVFAG